MRDDSRFRLPKVLAQPDAVIEAIQHESRFQPPYLPRTLLADAVAARLDDAKRILPGRFARGINVDAVEILAASKPRVGFRPVAALSFEEQIVYRLVSEPVRRLLSPASGIADVEFDLARIVQ